MNALNPIQSHAVSLLVNNKPGVLIRVSLVFSRRGWNIDSLAVSEGHDGRYSRMSITATGEAEMLQKILGQLNKLVDVIHASVHPTDEMVESELGLLKVACDLDQVEEILTMGDALHVTSIDRTQSISVFRLAGPSAVVDQFHRDVASRYDLLEYISTGALMVARGSTET